MKVIIFGGTGSIGRLAVREARARGHEVTVYSRDAMAARSTLSAVPAVSAVPASAPSGVSAPGPQEHPLRVIEGSLDDARAVAEAVDGQDAVIVALGAGRHGGVRAPGTAAVIGAMRETGCRRLIVQSTLGAGDSRPNLTWFWKYAMFGVLLRGAYADHADQERLTRLSGLDWTIVRPAAFTDGPRTGTALIGFGPEAKTKMTISRTDVADFLVEQLTDTSRLHQAPGLADA